MFKRAALISLLLVSPVQANETCLGMANLATTIMSLRQEGVPIQRMFEISDLPLARVMVRDAYGYPLFRTQEVKQSTINEFSNRIFLMCLDAHDE